MATVPCSHCGSEIEKYPSRIERNKWHFCSDDCEAAFKSEKQSGENNPNWSGGKVEIECMQCGETANKRRDLYEKDDTHFCSPSCTATYHGKRDGFKPGEENPSWKGGATDNPRYYGPNWHEQRDKALDRDDNECVECGADEPLVVHHIKGRDQFDTNEPGWWRDANVLSNLKTLCRSCHRSEHHERGDHEHTYGFETTP